MWYIITGVWGLGCMAIWSLCKAAGDADEQMDMWMKENNEPASK